VKERALHPRNTHGALLVLGLKDLFYYNSDGDVGIKETSDM